MPFVTLQRLTVAGQCYGRSNRTKLMYRLLRRKSRIMFWWRRFHAKVSRFKRPDAGAYFLLLSVIETSDVKEDSIDTGCVLHYKVNPYVNSPTDGLTCWAAGMRFFFLGGGVRGWRSWKSLLPVWLRQVGGRNERAWAKTRRLKKKKKKVEKMFHALMSLGRRKQSCNPILIAVDLLNRSSRFKSQQITQKAQGDVERGVGEACVIKCT